MNPLLAKLQPSLIRQVHALKRPTSRDLSLGEPSVRVEPELLERAERRFAAMSQGYTANLGLPELREAIAAYHRYPGLTEAANVAVTVGSQHALFCVFTALLQAGDEVVVFDPAYPAYEGLAKLCGAQAVRVRLSGDFRWTAAQVERVLTARTKLVVVASPSNPLGFIDSPGELQALARLAEARGFHVLSDEIYRELYFAHAPASVATMTSRAIVVGGLSKACAMTGQRLGWVIAPEALITAMWPLIQLSVTCAPTFAQCLAVEAFAESRFLSAHRGLYVERWRAAESVLRSHNLSFLAPDGAFFVCCALVGQGEDSLSFAKRMVHERDVVCVPGAAFGDALSHHVRLSFAGEPSVFAAGVQRLAAQPTT